MEAGKAAGYQVVVHGEYAPGAKDFSDLILKAKSANADAVFGIPTPPDGMTIVKQMKELGYTPKLTVLIRASDSPPWTKNLGKDGDYTVLAAGWHHAMRAPGVKSMASSGSTPKPPHLLHRRGRITARFSRSAKMGTRL